jgi:hypothetical protein
LGLVFFFKRGRGAFPNPDYPVKRIHGIVLLVQWCVSVCPVLNSFSSLGKLLGPTHVFANVCGVLMLII